MRTNYVLIDYESVQVKSLALLAAEYFKVHVFLGPNHTKLSSDFVLAMHALGDRGNYIRLSAAGPTPSTFTLRTTWVFWLLLIPRGSSTSFRRTPASIRSSSI